MVNFTSAFRARFGEQIRQCSCSERKEDATYHDYNLESVVSGHPDSTTVANNIFLFIYSRVKVLGTLITGVYKAADNARLSVVVYSGTRWRG